MGGKHRIASQLAAVMLRHTNERLTYWEPFLGGASVFAKMAPHFHKAVGSDVHEDLVLMWDAVVNGGWTPPDAVSEDEYRSLRHASPSALRGFVGYGCSFGGIWFEGYGRGNMSAAASSRTVMRQAAQIRDHGGIRQFMTRSYDTLRPPMGCVIYCDPPYQSRTKNHNSSYQDLDLDRLIRRARKWADRECAVFLSEYERIPGLSVVWEGQRSAGIRSGKALPVEYLYSIGA
ncbi:MAG TPA: DNA adenine methylase [Trebonia sp.]|nr:DNA adenine methylase [Trebonia sp.]